mmetsp:Transcript_61730/g.109613  ORF Transcript_61730/g.109613 Transcript_61730/m.109613 type:complete len:204 (+) Transcript_61730:551-1162(+)
MDACIFSRLSSLVICHLAFDSAVRILLTSFLVSSIIRLSSSTEGKSATGEGTPSFVGAESRVMPRELPLFEGTRLRVDDVLPLGLDLPGDETEGLLGLRSAARCRDWLRPDGVIAVSAAALLGFALLARGSAVADLLGVCERVGCTLFSGRGEVCSEVLLLRGLVARDPTDGRPLTGGPLFAGAGLTCRSCWVEVELVRRPAR